jgi:hypothetical protein
MDKEQFRKYVEDFWAWTSNTDRAVENWLYSLADWAEMMQARERKRREEEASR